MAEVTPHITMAASDRRTGMDLQQLERAISLARESQCTRIVKVRVGFKGQLQSIEFGPPERA